MTQDLDALPLPSFVKTSPARIYLVIGDNLEDGDEFNDLGDVTWCQDKQYETDIEYVRADVVREIVAAELRKALEGREPVAWRVRRSDGEYELFFHHPTAKRRAECFVPPARAEPLYTSPPPKSDEARDAERYRWLRRKVCVIGKSTYCGEETGIPIFDFVNLPDVGEVVNRDSASTLDAAIDAALAAQQSKGEAV